MAPNPVQAARLFKKAVLENGVTIAASPEFYLTLTEACRTGDNLVSKDFDMAAYWLLKAGQHADGVAALRQIEELKKGDADPRLQFAVGKRYILNEENGFGEAFIEKAAKQCLEKGDASLAFNIGQHYSKIGDGQTAEVYLAEASKRCGDDTDPGLRLEIGRHYLQAGQANIARPHLEQAIRQGRQEAKALLDRMNRAMQQ